MKLELTFVPGGCVCVCAVCGLKDAEGCFKEDGVHTVR